MHSIRAESVVQEAECAVYWTAAVDGGWHIKLQIVSDDSMTRGVTTRNTHAARCHIVGVAERHERHG